MSSSSSPTRLRIWSFGRFRTLQPEADVVGDGHVREQRVRLEHHADVALVRRPVGDVRRRRSMIVPGGRLLEARDHPQGRRLAAARRPEERDELARLGGQVEVLDGDATSPNCFWTPVSSRKLIGRGSSDLSARRRSGPGSASRGRCTAMTPIASHVSAEADQRRRPPARTAWLPPSSDEVRPERRPGEEGRDRVLADDDRQGQERAATGARPGGSAG